MICAICLRLGRPVVARIADTRLGDATERERIVTPLRPDQTPAGTAITIANGNALCQEHYRRLVDWQSETHGPLAIEALLRVMHDPDPIPAPPWADAP